MSPDIGKLAPQNIKLGVWCREVWPLNSLHYHEFIKQAILNYENCKPLHQALDWDRLAEKFFILKNDKNPILQIQPQFFDIKKDLFNRVCKHLRKKIGKMHVRCIYANNTSAS